MMHSEKDFPPPKVLPLRPDVRGLRTGIVNIGFIGHPRSSDWILVDAGLYGYGDVILDFANQTFVGPPKAIFLTHGHFDHVGTLSKLLDTWECPVYAHEEELPFLTGQQDYPKGDPTVGGGLMAWISPLYPSKGIDIGERVRAFPEDGQVPYLDKWEWLHTPGHTPGHVSFFRQEDQTLLAGDAFITVNQESVFSVLTQEKEFQGPPAYFTPDWNASKTSVGKLAALNPQFALTGHGEPVEGQELKEGLHRLVTHFDELAVPDKGRFVDNEE